MARLIFIFVLAGVVVGCGSTSKLEPSSDRPISTIEVGEPQEKKKPESLPDMVTRIAVEMSDAELAGQLVMTDLQGTLALSPEQRRELANTHIGGFILFGFNFRSNQQLKQLNAELQVVAKASNSQKVGALISIDQEGGAQNRLRTMPPKLGAPAIGRGNDLELAKTIGRETGKALSAVGINMNLAPVADLDVGPKHVMGGRSFGSDPILVSKMIKATLEGQRQYVIGSLKHFPGFGGTSENSDNGFATISRTKVEMEQSDLMPYRVLENSAGDSIMISHGVFKGWGLKTPASLSPSIYEYLRNELKYDGIAITDSLNARGLHQASTTTTPQNCALAIKAGADIALVTGSLETARLCQRRILDGITNGSIPRTRARDALTHVLVAKHRLKLL